MGLGGGSFDWSSLEGTKLSGQCRIPILIRNTDPQHFGWDYFSPDQNNIEIVFYQCNGVFPVLKYTKGYLFFRYKGSYKRVRLDGKNIPLPNDSRTCDVFWEHTSEPGIRDYDLCYKHEQGTPLKNWVVQHNLDTTDVIVKCFDQSGIEFTPALF
jgi:hypothetical protein